MHTDTVQETSALLGKELGHHGITGGSILTDEGVHLKADTASPEPIWGQGQCQGYEWFRAPQYPATTFSAPYIPPLGYSASAL